MNMWSASNVGLGTAQNLARHRRDLAFADEQEFQQIRHRVALGPLEVHVWQRFPFVADLQ